MVCWEVIATQHFCLQDRCCRCLSGSWLRRGSTPSGSRKCRWSNKRKWFAVGEKKKSHNGFHFLIGNKSHRVTHTHTQIHIDVDARANTATHSQTGVREKSNLLAATIRCDQSSNAICSCCWTYRHMEAVTGWLRPDQKWKQQETKSIAWIPPVFGPALVSQIGDKPIIS